jgi:hypothetical protein
VVRVYITQSIDDALSKDDLDCDLAEFESITGNYRFLYLCTNTILYSGRKSEMGL